jgi:septum formation topological specificity factor MinE
MSNLPDPSSNNTNQLMSHQNPHSNQQPTSSNNNLNVLNHSGLITIDFNHQTFQTWLDILVDSSTTEDIKLKTIQDLSFNWELMQTLPSYAQLVEDAMHKFMRLLRETEPQFINESTVQQLRKKILDIIYRTTPVVANNINVASGTGSLDPRTALIRDVLLVIYQLLERDNEDNVNVCLKIIVEYHRHLKTTAILTNEVKIH